MAKDVNVSLILDNVVHGVDVNNCWDLRQTNFEQIKEYMEICCFKSFGNRYLAIWLYAPYITYEPN